MRGVRLLAVLLPLLPCVAAQSAQLIQIKNHHETYLSQPSYIASEILRTESQPTHELTGASIANAGDLDGNELPDTLVGSPSADGDRGSGGGMVTVYSDYVDPSSVGPEERVYVRQTARTIFVGLGGEELLNTHPEDAGSSVAGVGDFDGDGYRDILIGAAHNEHTDVQAGAAYLVFGPLPEDQVPLHGPKAMQEHGLHIVTFVGEFGFDQAGTSVAGVGDVNGDGLDDMLIGAPGYDSTPAAGDQVGMAYLLFGSKDRYEELVQNDGLDIGEYEMPRTLPLAWVGSLFGVRLPGSARLLRDEENDVWMGEEAGTSVAGAGDFDGDGCPDFLVGAPSHPIDGQDSGGAVYLILGCTALDPVTSLNEIGVTYPGARFRRDLAYAHFGVSVARAGDIDADGLSDIVIGAYLDDTAADAGGAAFVIYGSEKYGTSGEHFALELVANDEAVAYYGSDPDLIAGYAVSGGADLNGDGLDDVFIGAPNWHSPGSSDEHSYVHVIYGASLRDTGEYLLVSGSNWLTSVSDLILKSEVGGYDSLGAALAPLPGFDPALEVDGLLVGTPRWEVYDFLNPQPHLDNGAWYRFNLTP